MTNDIGNNDVFKFKAVVTYERYYNSDSDWGVFGFSTTDDIPFCVTQSHEDVPFFEDEQKDNKRFGTLAGKMQQLTIGGEYLVEATHKVDGKYGDQYTPKAVYAIIPQSKETQIIFLKSLLSETVAENLVDAYPNIVNDVADGVITDIDYSKVKGVGAITWEKIKEKIIANYLVSDIIVMLKPLGITYTMIKRLLSDEPNPTLLKQKINNNPYLLVKIKGLGFQKIDSLALKLKPNLLNSIERLVAYIRYYFNELGDNDGHTWVSKEILRTNISNNVVECCDKFDWLLDNNSFLHVDNYRVGLKSYYDIEKKILDILVAKSNHSTNELFNLTETQIQKGISEAEKQQGFTYTQEQLSVIRASLSRSVSLITGKAGCGKTSIARAIINVYNVNNYSLCASALSAMAAKRITEATSFPATTIHRTLGCTGINDFQFNKDNHLCVNVAFLDEGSMVNASLFLSWLEAIDDNTRIIISGDNKQLPPIGFGNIFSDLLDMLDDSNVSKLTKPMRQAEKSGILSDANIIRTNQNPIGSLTQAKIVHGELQDMFYMFRNNRESLFKIAINTYLKTVESEGIDNVAIIVPRKKDCLNSTIEINKVIQDKLLSNVTQTISNVVFDFKLGAKVMQTVNDYEKNVFNGEIGYITYIGKRKKDNGSSKLVDYCIVTFDNGLSGKKKVGYFKTEMNCLDLAYALTCHKCQGSGVKTVIGIIDNTHYQLLDNCMLYTLITRAKQRCLLLAEPQAFNQCIRTSHNRRNTWMQTMNNEV